MNMDLDELIAELQRIRAAHDGQMSVALQMGHFTPDDLHAVEVNAEAGWVYLINNP